jgi:hypothetical protein
VTRLRRPLRAAPSNKSIGTTSRPGTSISFQEYKISSEKHLYSFFYRYAEALEKDPLKDLFQIPPGQLKVVVEERYRRTVNNPIPVISPTPATFTCRF